MQTRIFAMSLSRLKLNNLLSVVQLSISISERLEMLVKLTGGPILNIFFFIIIMPHGNEKKELLCNGLYREGNYRSEIPLNQL
jgi:hypothetical protein